MFKYITGKLRKPKSEPHKSFHGEGAGSDQQTGPFSGIRDRRGPRGRPTSGTSPPFSVPPPELVTLFPEQKPRPSRLNEVQI